jgi:ferredoxin
VTLTVDPERCQGHGRCVLINPALFDINDEGIAVVLAPQPFGAAVADAERAIGNCPEQAIAWAGAAEVAHHG